MTLALAQGAEGASLGIGIDVFQRAYEFAASRVRASEDLRLLSCTDARCLWALGDGVTLMAEHPVGSLDVTRIEVTLDGKQPTGADTRRRYEEACLTIVGLVDPHRSVPDRREVASAIASPVGAEARRIRIERPDRDISVYGTRSATTGGASAPSSRCGAVASYQ